MLGGGSEVTFTITINTETGAGTELYSYFVSIDPECVFAEKLGRFTLIFGNQYFPTSHDEWAGSNIYWDGSKLTFRDVYEYSGQDVTESRQQGVYFKWGSLWGIGANYAGGAAWNTAAGGNPVYKPTNGVYSPAYGVAFADIPKIDMTLISSITPAGKLDRERAYLAEDTNPDAGTGDICKYLMNLAPRKLLYGKKWRMPTYMEIDHPYTVKVYNQAELQPTDPGGTTLMTNYFYGSSVDPETDWGNRVPINGARDENGTIYDVNLQCHLWSSFCPQNRQGAYDWFTEVSPPSSYSAPMMMLSSRDNAFGVRCVVDK